MMMNLTKGSIGWIEVVCGPMFSGKSEELIRRFQPVASLKRMKIYFATGASDDYSFELGGEALHKLLDKRGIPHEWHLDPGRHSAAFALQHFGPALEFSSKAFGLTK